MVTFSILILSIGADTRQSGKVTFPNSARSGSSRQTFLSGKSPVLRRATDKLPVLYLIDPDSSVPLGGLKRKEVG